MIIAKGDTGFIFRGLINDQLYTIKRLTPSSTDSLLPIQELRCAARFLCQLRHRNIVSLVGYCEEKGEMIHVYEHVKNGSLYDHLHNKNYDPLPWKRRLEICIGVARALHYLHIGARFAVIHRDVSSKNILLDSQWRSELHNFGFARRGHHSMSNDPISFYVVDTYLMQNWRRISDLKFVGLDKRPTMSEVEMTQELALELQKKADSEMESINPQGECIFEEA
ncbi:hypothetical protein PTKIN_Ptkin15bG0178000 [Pterospermum kingtungense]